MGRALRFLRSMLLLAATGAAIPVSAAEAPNVEVVFFTPEIVRIVKRPAGAMPLRDSFAVVAEPQDVSVAVSDERGVKVYRSAALRVVVGADGDVCFETADGRPLLAECGFSFERRGDGGPDAESFAVSQSWRLGAGEPVRARHLAGRRHLPSRQEEKDVPGELGGLCADRSVREWLGNLLG